MESADVDRRCGSAELRSHLALGRENANFCLVAIQFRKPPVKDGLVRDGDDDRGGLLAGCADQLIDAIGPVDLNSRYSGIEPRHDADFLKRLGRRLVYVSEIARELRIDDE